MGGARQWEEGIREKSGQVTSIRSAPVFVNGEWVVYIRELSEEWGIDGVQRDAVCMAATDGRADGLAVARADEAVRIEHALEVFAVGEEAKR